MFVADVRVNVDAIHANSPSFSIGLTVLFAIA